jgi:hypothetical protein
VRSRGTTDFLNFCDVGEGDVVMGQTGFD